MVKGRRVKAIVAKACTDNKNFCPVKRRNGTAGQTKKLGSNPQTDHCITDYFQIDRFPHNEGDYESCTYDSKIPANIICEEVEIKPRFEANGLDTPKKGITLKKHSMQH